MGSPYRDDLPPEANFGEPDHAFRSISSTDFIRSGLALIVITGHAAEESGHGKADRLATELAIAGVHVHDEPFRIGPIREGIQGDVAGSFFVVHAGIEALA